MFTALPFGMKTLKNTAFGLVEKRCRKELGNPLVPPTFKSPLGAKWWNKVQEDTAHTRSIKPWKNLRRLLCLQIQYRTYSLPFFVATIVGKCTLVGQTYTCRANVKLEIGEHAQVAKEQVAPGSNRSATTIRRCYHRASLVLPKLLKQQQRWQMITRQGLRTSTRPPLWSRTLLNSRYARAVDLIWNRAVRFVGRASQCCLRGSADDIILPSYLLVPAGACW